MREQAGWQAIAAPPPVPTRGWRLALTGFWLAACGWLVAGRWAAIRAMALPDADDDMRLLQVRGLLHGQRWFDLAQHRLDPARGGASIHWTRLVDLPLAAIIAPLTPLVGEGGAERIACAAVPLLTLGVAMALAAAIVRRLVAPGAWAWGPAMLLMASPALGMMQPGRIDHHGWQIAALLATILGLIDARRHRGGIVAGLSVAASLAIGVEMLPYLALAGGAAALFWVADESEAPRLRAFALACGLGTAAALLLFVPPDARGLGCDALSLAYAAPLGIGCAALLAATAPPLADRRQRAVALLVAGGLAALPLLGPARACVADPYAAIDPEARRLWLSIVAEALPLARQSTEMILASLVLPAIGLAGAATMLIRRHGEAGAWLLVAAVSALGIALSLLQTRAGITAQAMAVPGAAALGWHGRRWLARRASLLARVGGSVLLFLCVAGLLPRLAIAALTAEPSSPAEDARDARDAACAAPAAMAALDVLPAGIFLATIDATPPLLLHTRHSGIAGPYHRNGRAIAEVMQAFAGDDAVARAVVARHRARYVFLCGDPAEMRVYAKRNPDGFGPRLAGGRAPGWLAPVPLKGTPWRAWRVAR